MHWRLCRVLGRGRRPWQQRGGSGHGGWPQGSALASVRSAPARSTGRQLAQFAALVPVFTTAGFLWQHSAQRPDEPPGGGDEAASDRSVEEALQSHPLVLALREQTRYLESRPHRQIDPHDRPHSFTAGVLAGTGRLSVAPIVFADRHGEQAVIVAHLGRAVAQADDPEHVHRGLLATLLDEGLARCCFAALPNQIGVTASLSIVYKSPASVDQIYVLRARTEKVEGRKAWVSGSIESLDRPGTVICEAEALFVEPKYARMMKRLVQ